jgi:flagellar L-ring protein precursor FlgH
VIGTFTPRLPALLPTGTLLLALLGGCASAPMMTGGDEFRNTEVYQPAPPVPNGSIYQSSGAYMPLFEDLRPRRVGDVVTIVLNEQVNASKNSSASASRSSASSFVPTTVPAGLEELNRWGFDITGDSEFTGAGGAQANNRLTGTITVTVADVLVNGNLRVVGEKQIMINQGTEYIRFSGIVNPRFVDAQNSIQSSQVADARIEYTGKGYISEAQRMGWLQRFFVNVSPF